MFSNFVLLRCIYAVLLVTGSKYFIAIHRVYSHSRSSNNKLNHGSIDLWFTQCQEVSRSTHSVIKLKPLISCLVYWLFNWLPSSSFGRRAKANWTMFSEDSHRVKLEQLYKMPCVNWAVLIVFLNIYYLHKIWHWI